MGFECKIICENCKKEEILNDWNIDDPIAESIEKPWMEINIPENSEEYYWVCGEKCKLELEISFLKKCNRFSKDCEAPLFTCESCEEHVCKKHVNETANKDIVCLKCFQKEKKSIEEKYKKSKDIIQNFYDKSLYLVDNLNTILDIIKKQNIKFEQIIKDQLLIINGMKCPISVEHVLEYNEYFKGTKNPDDFLAWIIKNNIERLRIQIFSSVNDKSNDDE